MASQGRSETRTAGLRGGARGDGFVLGVQRPRVLPCFTYNYIPAVTRQGAERTEEVGMPVIHIHSLDGTSHTTQLHVTPGITICFSKDLSRFGIDAVLEFFAVMLDGSCRSGVLMVVEAGLKRSGFFSRHLVSSQTDH